MALSFLKTDQSLKLAQDTLPAIAGRGREAAPFEMPDEVQKLVDEAMGRAAGWCAPFATANKTDDKKPSPELLTFVRKLNGAIDTTKAYAVIRSNSDGQTSTAYVVAGAQPVITRTRKSNDEEVEVTA